MALTIMTRRVTELVEATGVAEFGDGMAALAAPTIGAGGATADRSLCAGRTSGGGRLSPKKLSYALETEKNHQRQLLLESWHIHKTPRNINDAQERAPLLSFTIEVHAISDYNHTTHFGNQTEAHIEYLMAFWNSVSLRTQQLNPPGFIALTAIEMFSTATEPYLTQRPDGKLVSNETLLKLQQYTWSKRSVRMADAVFLITARDIVDLIPGGVSTDAAGENGEVAH
ncbi:uncharacterized protein LOC125939866 [Dermacentor silvarum]|uniref:uncharacterized protein LOC125939866 n=1 Tax=Dermacentor silvarum TaxID=543639 RepID=UPI0021007DB0|nr:uncharacterized protein LOC125939866 [Dermacentor silvarum]